MQRGKHCTYLSWERTSRSIAARRYTNKACVHERIRHACIIPAPPHPHLTPPQRWERQNTIKTHGRLGAVGQLRPKVASIEKLYFSIMCHRNRLSHWNARDIISWRYTSSMFETAHQFQWSLLQINDQTYVHDHLSTTYPWMPISLEETTMDHILGLTIYIGSAVPATNGLWSYTFW